MCNDDKTKHDFDCSFCDEKIDINDKEKRFMIINDYNKTIALCHKCCNNMAIFFDKIFDIAKKKI
jgi:hypothetical protein